MARTRAKKGSLENAECTKEMGRKTSRVASKRDSVRMENSKLNVSMRHQITDQIDRKSKEAVIAPNRNSLGFEKASTNCDAKPEKLKAKARHSEMVVFDKEATTNVKQLKSTMKDVRERVQMHPQELKDPESSGEESDEDVVSNETGFPHNLDSSHNSDVDKTKIEKPLTECSPQLRKRKISRVASKRDSVRMENSKLNVSMRHQITDQIDRKSKEAVIAPNRNSLGFEKASTNCDAKPEKLKAKARHSEMVVFDKKATTNVKQLKSTMKDVRERVQMHPQELKDPESSGEMSDEEVVANETGFPHNLDSSHNSDVDMTKIEKPSTGWSAQLRKRKKMTSPSKPIDEPVEVSSSDLSSGDEDDDTDDEDDEILAKLLKNRGREPEKRKTLKGRMTRKEFLAKKAPAIPEASTANKWNPVEAARKYLYDGQKGVPLPEDDQVANLTNAFKSKKSLNYQSFLLKASSFHNTDKNMEDLSLGIAWIVAMMNNWKERNEKQPNEKLTASFLKFNENIATAWNGKIETPSGVQLDIDKLFCQTVARYTTNKSIDVITRQTTKWILRKLSLTDEFLPAYSSSQGGVNAIFVPLGVDFFKSVTDLIMKSFDIEKRVENPGQVYNRINSLSEYTTGNFLQKKRRRMKRTHPNYKPRRIAKTLKKNLKLLGSDNIAETENTDATMQEDSEKFLGDESDEETSSK